MADYYPTGELDPVAAGIAAYFAQFPAWTGLTTRPLTETRAEIHAATNLSGEPAMASVEEHLVSVAGGEVPFRLFRPHGPVRALILWAHGGGWCIGSNDEIENFCRLLAQESQCAVGSIEYRLAPEHKFPVPVEDVEAAVVWAAARAAQLAGADVPLVVAGDSAGGNLATVATRRIHAAGSARIAANVLVYPSVDTPESPSLHRFEVPFLTVAEAEFMVAQYLPDAASGQDPDFAPMLAHDLSVLPPTFVITASHDILTEQGEAYAAKLGSLGVPVRTSRHQGMIHGFLTLDPFFPGAAGAAIREIAQFIEETCP
ncbi:MAG: alpha/beta hydrolase [Novosphingobium sp.]